MSESDTYHSIAAPSTGIYREKASKFKAFAIPVTSEGDVRDQLAQLRKSHHDANHHCFAYRIGYPDFLYRVNDDGEPSGSAGKPIYGQILSRELSDVMVVVVRYFGGTKLGIPGLIRAYKSASSEALDHATPSVKTVMEPLKVSFPFERMNDVMRILKQEPVTILSQESVERITLNLEVRKSRAPEIVQRLNSIMNVYALY